MKNKYLVYVLFSLILSFLVFVRCSNHAGDDHNITATDLKSENGGFDSQIAWGEHLVKITGCSDCHTPKKMGAQGPEDDTTLWLSGHPEKMPPPQVNRMDVEKQGLALTNTMTSWIGPWGVSYAANLTSDPSGIGNWQENNFITAIREGKYMGIENARSLMPPMPWRGYSHMTDAELKAIFAYLKSTKPVRNIVPPYETPALALR
jgi:mono/diheme cytochrome c family protein